jgi:hypothetical protein
MHTVRAFCARSSLRASGRDTGAHKSPDNGASDQSVVDISDGQRPAHAEIAPK